MPSDPINPLLFLNGFCVAARRGKGWQGGSVLMVGWLVWAHTAWTAGVGSQHTFGRDMMSYPACLLAVPSLSPTTLQELVQLHCKQQVWGCPPSGEVVGEHCCPDD